MAKISLAKEHGRKTILKKIKGKRQRKKFSTELELRKNGEHRDIAKKRGGGE